MAIRRSSPSKWALGHHPQAFDGVRVLIRMSELVERYHLNRQRMPEEVSNATPLAALNFEASVEEKATDLARVILAGRLTDEEKHYLYYERLIKPVPVEKDGQVVGFQREHPRAPVEIAADIDWDVFSGQRRKGASYRGRMLGRCLRGKGYLDHFLISARSFCCGFFLAFFGSQKKPAPKRAPVVE